MLGSLYFFFLFAVEEIGKENKNGGLVEGNKEEVMGFVLWSLARVVKRETRKCFRGLLNKAS